MSAYRLPRRITQRSISFAQLTTSSLAAGILPCRISTCSGIVSTAAAQGMRVATETAGKADVARDAAWNYTYRGIHRSARPVSIVCVDGSGSELIAM